MLAIISSYPQAMIYMVTMSALPTLLEAQGHRCMYEIQTGFCWGQTEDALEAQPPTPRLTSPQQLRPIYSEALLLQWEFKDFHIKAKMNLNLSDP